MGWALSDAAVFKSFLLLEVTCQPYSVSVPNKMAHQVGLGWCLYFSLLLASYLGWVGIPRRAAASPTHLCAKSDSRNCPRDSAKATALHSSSVKLSSWELPAQTWTEATLATDP